MRARLVARPGWHIIHTPGHRPRLYENHENGPGSTFDSFSRASRGKPVFDGLFTTTSGLPFHLQPTAAPTSGELAYRPSELFPFFTFVGAAVFVPLYGHVH